MEQNKKTLLQRVWVGIKEGATMQIVPEYLKNFDNLIWVKIYKFLGVITTSYILSSKYDLLKLYNIHDLNHEIFIVSSFISITYLLYRLYYSVSVVIYVFILFKNKKHWVVNTPEDHLSSILKAGLLVLKTSTNVVIGSGVVFTVGSELDDIAEQAGRQKVFIPTIKATLIKWGVENHVDNMLDYAGFKKSTEENRKKAITEAAKAFSLPENVVEKALDIEANKTISDSDSSDLKNTIKELE